MGLTQQDISTYGLWIQSGAIVISAVGIIISNVVTRRVARRRATLDLIMQEESNPDLIKQRTEFVRLRDAGHLAQWANPEQTASDKTAVIRSVLNRYEMVAIGIRQH